MNNDELLKENISIALKKIGNYIYEGAFPFISSFKYIKKLGDDEVYEDENSAIIKGFCHFISQQVLCIIALSNMYPGVLKNIIFFRLGGYLLFKLLGSATGYGFMRLKYYLEDNKILKKEMSVFYLLIQIYYFIIKCVKCDVHITCLLHMDIIVKKNL